MPAPDVGPVGNMKRDIGPHAQRALGTGHTPDSTARSQHSQESLGNSEGGEWGGGLAEVEFDGVTQNSPFPASPAEGGHVHSLVMGHG